MKEYTCAFTGHRPQKLPFGSRESDPRCIALKEKLRTEIERLILEKDVTAFISGMAIGVDTYAAEQVLSLKEKYPNITLEAAVPCLNQAEKWNAAQQERYKALLERCDKVTVLSQAYTKTCMQERNEYMVDSSSYVIAVWDGKPGGTGNTVRYCRSLGREVTVIDPSGM